MTKPADGWEKSDFDASSWQPGKAGFGSKGTPGAKIETEWTSKDLWLRRTFTLETNEFAELFYFIHHDEDATIFINGQQVETFQGYTTSYEEIPASKATLEALQIGDNVMAIHCSQTTGGQFIDVGFVDLQVINENP